MPKRGKLYRETAAKYDKANLYEIEEAMKLAVETSRAKFDETIEVHIKLGVDGRHADQQGSNAGNNDPQHIYVHTQPARGFVLQ